MYCKTNILRIIGGIDEAGRGSILGPMVIAGVSFEEKILENLKVLGIRDSKLLSAQRRTQLFDRIKQLSSSYMIIKVNCKEIDEHEYKKKLNFLESIYMAKIASKIKSDVIYIDCCDSNPSRFKSVIYSLTEKNNLSILSFHKADRINIAVAAASILAKVTRDKEIELLKKQFPLIGSGYPSDKITATFLEKWIEEYSSPPFFSRHSWKTLKSIIKRKNSLTISTG